MDITKQVVDINNNIIVAIAVFLIAIFIQAKVKSFLWGSLPFIAIFINIALKLINQEQDFGLICYLEIKTTVDFFGRICIVFFLIDTLYTVLNSIFKRKEWDWYWNYVLLVILAYFTKENMPNDMASANWEVLKYLFSFWGLSICWYYIEIYRAKKS